MTKACVIFIGGTGGHVLRCLLSLCVLKREKIMDAPFFYIDPDITVDSKNSLIKGGTNLFDLTKVESKFSWRKICFPSNANSSGKLGEQLANRNKKDNTQYCDQDFFDFDLLEREIKHGFFGLPALGASISGMEFENLVEDNDLKLPRKMGKNISNDKFSSKKKKQSLKNYNKIIIVGSSLGGTGAGLGPALAEKLKLFYKNEKHISLVTYVGPFQTVMAEDTIKTDQKAMKNSEDDDAFFSDDEDMTTGIEEDESSDIPPEEEKDKQYHGDFESNRQAALFLYSQKRIFNKICLVGLPDGLTEKRINIGSFQQSDQSTLVHLIMSRMVIDLVHDEDKLVPIENGFNYFITQDHDINLSKDFLMRKDNVDHLLNNVDHLLIGMLLEVILWSRYFSALANFLSKNGASVSLDSDKTEHVAKFVRGLQCLYYFGELVLRTKQTYCADSINKELPYITSLFLEVFDGTAVKRSFLRVPFAGNAEDTSTSNSGNSFDELFNKSFYLNNLALPHVLLKSRTPNIAVQSIVDTATKTDKATLDFKQNLVDKNNDIYRRIGNVLGVSKARRLKKEILIRVEQFNKSAEKKNLKELEKAK